MAKTNKQEKKTAKAVPTYGLDAEGNPLCSQEALVLDYLLRTGGRVSNRFMAETWGFHRGSALIHRLKKKLLQQGGNLELRWQDCEGVNRFGARTTWREFWIVKVR